MADATISAVQPGSGPSGSAVTINGAELTKTTMMLFVDGVQTAFTWLSATQISAVIEGDAGDIEIAVEKGGVRSSPLSFTITEASMSDQGSTDIPAGGSEGNTGPVAISADDLKTEQEKGGADPVSPPVEPGPAAAPVGVGAREPYPTGSPATEAKPGVPMNEAPKPAEPA